MLGWIWELAPTAFVLVFVWALVALAVLAGLRLRDAVGPAPRRRPS